MLHLPARRYKYPDMPNRKIYTAAHKEQVRQMGISNRKHGHALPGNQSRTYQSWVHLKRRCLSPKDAAYPRYGGRGITICARWMDFRNFLADMGAAPDGLEIERLDNESGYEPSNCIWTTRKRQMRNTHRALMMTIDGETLSIADWAERSGLSYDTLKHRLRSHCSPEEFLRPSKPR